MPHPLIRCSLVAPGPGGSQRLPKRYRIVPCGTYDYISPEILQVHEEALVVLGLDDDNDDDISSASSINKKIETLYSIARTEIPYIELQYQHVNIKMLIFMQRATIHISCNTLYEFAIYYNSLQSHPILVLNAMHYNSLQFIILYFYS